MPPFGGGRNLVNMLAGPQPQGGRSDIVQTLQPRPQPRQPSGYGGLAQAMQPLAAPVLAQQMRQPDPAARMQKIAAMLAYRDSVQGGGAQGQPDAQSTGDTSGGSLADVMGAILGSPVPGQRPHAATHATSGLAGYPAFDYMAAAGTPTVAPATGRIMRLSGKDPSLGGSPGGPLGYSIYLSGGGKSYFLTHLDKLRVKAGQRVRQGQQIAQVAAGPASWSSPHVHMGIRG